MTPKQIKQAVVSYADKVILGLMGILFAVSIYQMLIKRDPKVLGLRDEIVSSAKRLEQSIASSTPPPLPKLDHARVLSERFAHIPVIEPYPRYVLFPPEPVFWRRFQLVVNKEAVLEIPEVQVVRAVEYDKEYLRVEAVEPFDADDPLAGSRVKVMPLKPTTGFIKLQVQDIDEIRYVADIFINERVIPKKPLPPKDPRIEVIRGKALVSVLFDNPPTLPRNAAPTAGVNIYRKIASRPDAEYRLLNDKGPLVPNEAEREQIRKKLSLTEQPGQPASTPERRPGRGEVEEAKPVEAAKPVSGAWGPAPGDIRRDAAQPDTEKSLVWLLDEGVSPGETYLYKIVSVTEAIKGADQERQESDPWVSPPVEVPSDVEYRLVSVREDVATIRVWKFDYKYDKWFEKTFQVAAGMKIGRPERVKADKADAESVEIDFSTGARLVAAIEEAPTIDVQVKWERKVVGGRVQVVQVPVLVDKKLSMIVVTARNGGLESQYRGKAQPPERVQKKLKSTIEKREVKAEPKAPGDIEPPAPGPGPGPGPGPDVRKPPRTGR